MTKQKAKVLQEELHLHSHSVRKAMLSVIADPNDLELLLEFEVAVEAFISVAVDAT